MKRNIYIIASLLLVSFTACKKFLDTKPQAFLEPDKYYVGANTLNALAGVYNPLTGIGGEYVSGLLAFTDETHFGGQSRGPGANQQYFYANSASEGLWQNCYKGIERANLFMQYVDANNPSNQSKADLQAAYGEALFLRAYYYFTLVSNFGAVPLKLKPTSSSDSYNIPATPMQDVYNQVVADMKRAETYVYDIAKVGSASRVSKSAVQGILARVYLKMAGFPLNGGTAGSAALYDSTRTYCKKVMAAGHRLNDSYSQVFNNMAADVYETKESIWEIDYWGNAGVVNKILGGVGSQNGIAFNNTTVLPGHTYNVQQEMGFCYGYVFATKKLYDLYDKSDARRDWNIQNISYVVNASNSPMIYKTAFAPLTGTTTYNYYRNSAKWRREFEVGAPKDQNNSGINFPLLRYADVLLMLAEADLRLNGGTCTAEGIAAVNAVRERGYGFVASTAPLKSLVVVNQGSGYNTTIVNNYNNASAGNTNTGNWLGYAATLNATGNVSGITLLSGGIGFTGTPTITLGTPWTANTSYLANQQVYYNGNLYTIPTAGKSNDVPPVHTTGSSTVATTGIVFTWAGVPATAQGTLLTKADVDLTSVSFQNIMDERARELCYEGLRKADLVRWGLFFSTMTDVNNQILAWNNFNSSLNKNMAALGFSNVAYSSPDKFLLLPIPPSEMNQNRSLKQNPGY